LTLLLLIRYAFLSGTWVFLARLPGRVFHFYYGNFDFCVSVGTDSHTLVEVCAKHSPTLNNSQEKRLQPMGILESAKPAIIICTRDRARATAFYRDTLGLTVAHEDSFAAVFNIGGVTLRVSRVADFTPHEHTILGFNVPDVASTVKALRGKGVTFNSYQHVSQDEVGIWTAPGGAVRVAWFKDPDGNVLSVTNA
jgi:catechol 2,3-dioxygenase-like lactoylglutathione lyase family enzyme